MSSSVVMFRLTVLQIHSFILSRCFVCLGHGPESWTIAVKGTDVNKCSITRHQLSLVSYRVMMFVFITYHTHFFSASRRVVFGGHVLESWTTSFFSVCRFSPSSVSSFQLLLEWCVCSWRRKHPKHPLSAYPLIPLLYLVTLQPVLTPLLSCVNEQRTLISHSEHRPPAYHLTALP